METGRVIPLDTTRGSRRKERRIALDRGCVCIPRLVDGRGSFRVFTEGDDLHEAMLASIRGARTTIRMESFIFQADEIGALFADALTDRARAGVDVRLHLDSRGTASRWSRALEKKLREAGVRLRWFHAWSWRRPFRYVRRNHRKLLVVDEDEAYLGGFNIRRENSRRLSGDARQRDTHVSVRGEIARQAAGLFDRLWNRQRTLRAEAVPEEPEGVEALLVPNASRRCRQRLACLHAGLVDRARDFVYLTTPFFGPGTVVGRALGLAADRGIDVRLLVPRWSDPPVAGWATRAAYEPLLRAGVRIFEYLPRKLHAKTSVIDGEWAIVGSANLDYLSLFVNQELVLIVRDRIFAGALHERFLDDLGEAGEVPLAEWRRRGRGERLVEALGFAGRRFL